MSARKFVIGDTAFVANKNGTESEVRIDEHDTNERYWVIDLKSREPMIVSESELLPPKQPGFGKRDLVYTTSADHPGKQGTIIATGKTKSMKLAFQVRFSDDQTDAQWFTEDEVLTQDAAPHDGVRPVRLL